MANFAERDQQILNDFNANLKQLNQNPNLEECEMQYNDMFKGLLHDIVDLHGTTDEGKGKLKELFDEELFSKQL